MMTPPGDNPPETSSRVPTYLLPKDDVQIPLEAGRNPLDQMCRTERTCSFDNNEADPLDSQGSCPTQTAPAAPSPIRASGSSPQTHHPSVVGPTFVSARLPLSACQATRELLESLLNVSSTPSPNPPSPFTPADESFPFTRTSS